MSDSQRDVASPAVSNEVELASLSVNSRDFLAQTALRLLSDPRWADFKLQCGDKAWYVNKAWLCTNSPLLAKLYAVVRYLLHGDYDEDEYDDADFENVEDSSPVLFNAYVLQTAWDLQLEGLARIAVHKFFPLAEQELLRSNYVVLIREVYGSGGALGALRSVIVKACAPHADKILGPEAWLKPSEMFDFRHLRAVALEIQQFAADLKETIPPPPPSQHDCRKLGCCQKWHVCLCEKCHNEVAMKEMVLRKNAIVYCPSCGSGGCTVKALET